MLAPLAQPSRLVRGRRSQCSPFAHCAPHVSPCIAAHLQRRLASPLWQLAPPVSHSLGALLAVPAPAPLTRGGPVKSPLFRLRTPRRGTVARAVRAGTSSTPASATFLHLHQSAPVTVSNRLPSSAAPPIAAARNALKILVGHDAFGALSRRARAQTSARVRKARRDRSAQPAPGWGEGSLAGLSSCLRCTKTWSCAPPCQATLDSSTSCPRWPPSRGPRPEGTDRLPSPSRRNDRRAPHPDTGYLPLVQELAPADDGTASEKGGSRSTSWSSVGSWRAGAREEDAHEVRCACLARWCSIKLG